MDQSVHRMQARGRAPTHSYVHPKEDIFLDLIRIVFEEIRFFPKEKSYLSEKMMSILLRPIRRCLPGS